MEIQHFSKRKRAKAGNLKCEFCSLIFQTTADKNDHVLNHFSKENCVKCNEDLIRIGENLYVLHSPITCIAPKLMRKRKKKSKLATKSSYEDENTKEGIENKKSSSCHVQNNFRLEHIEIKIERDYSYSHIEPAAIEVNAKIEEKNAEANMISNKNSSHEINGNPKTKVRNEMGITVAKQRKRGSKNKTDVLFVKCEYKGCDKLIRRSSKGPHMKTHADNRFECDICHSSLASKNGLRAHFNLHFPKKELKCMICSMTYRSESSLSQHVRFVHNKEAKRFICSICGKALRKSHLLKEHMNKHNGKRPYDCPHDGCEKRFYTKSHRSEHLRSHTGEKPFACSVQGCNRQFAYAIDFKRHKYKAHGIFTKKHPCSICSQVFPESMLLKKHLKSHENNDS